MPHSLWTSVRFFHLCQLLCRDSQPNLRCICVNRRQHKTQQSSKYLLGYFNIFQMFAGLSKLYHPLSAPSKTPSSALPPRLFIVCACRINTVSSAQPSRAVRCFPHASIQIKQQCIFSEVSLNGSEVTGFGLKTEIFWTHLDKVG